MENKNIEVKVADTLLQSDTKVKIGGTEYSVAPPSIATLVMVSKYISALPKIDFDSTKAIAQALAYAKDYDVLGEIVATIILGAKFINEHSKRVVEENKKSLFGWIKREKKGIEPTDCVSVLATRIMEDSTPQELSALVVRLISQMQLGDFFGITTFLSEVNMTKKTKVEN